LGEIDFVTALGRLLHDVRLREAFRADRAHTVEALNVRTTDCQAIVRLAPDEVEFQARILLKKRLDAIQRFIPITCERLGEGIWTTFVDYSNKISSLSDVTEDACCFAEYVAEAVPAARCSSEVNRLRFAKGRSRFCMRFTRDAGRSMLGGRALQAFVRWSDGGWKEWRVGIRSYAARR
jgi:hypothetical protein